MHLLKNADENNFFKGDASFLAAALRWNSQRLRKTNNPRYFEEASL